MSHVVSQSAAESRPRLNKYGYNCIGKHFGMAFSIGFPLFAGAGTLNWDWAWIITLTTLIGWTLLSIVLVIANPELLNERGKRAKALVNTKRWDWGIMGIYAVLLLAEPLVAGLDYRYAWSSPSADSVKVVGIAVLVVSFIPLTWSMAVNRYFEPTVRIQDNREHRVITSGPYRYVRHPGYVAVILQFVALPLSLGTFTAWIPALLGVALFILRTALEDQTLQNELPGYKEYAERVHSRLLPGVW